MSSRSIPFLQPFFDVPAPSLHDPGLDRAQRGDVARAQHHHAGLAGGVALHRALRHKDLLAEVFGDANANKETGQQIPLGVVDQTSQGDLTRATVHRDVGELQGNTAFSG